MSKFELNGEQRDLVRSYAIHQDFKSLWAFIEDLVGKQEPVLHEAYEYDSLPDSVKALTHAEEADGKADDGAAQSAT